MRLRLVAVGGTDGRRAGNLPAYGIPARVTADEPVVGARRTAVTLDLAGTAPLEFWTTAPEGLAAYVDRARLGRPDRSLDPEFAS